MDTECEPLRKELVAANTRIQAQALHLSTVDVALADALGFDTSQRYPAWTRLIQQVREESLELHELRENRYREAALLCSGIQYIAGRLHDAADYAGDRLRGSQLSYYCNLLLTLLKDPQEFSDDMYEEEVTPDAWRFVRGQ